ncbi:hypothetical protein [Novosphingobium sp.]|uniref:hypothetical protein n=1 Tax=Novosphingobium sp. TaxID=1874826 RepID=UPI00286DCB95|nr:hypothetical protein [Novosphingobium sp.]
MTRFALAAGAAMFALAASGASGKAATSLTVAQARASLAGTWSAELQYRDYQSGKWEGIPFTTTIAMVADGVTQIRTSAYDDGPKVGTVWITTVAMLGKDGVTEYAGTYRAGRPAEHETSRLRIASGTDSAHWVLVSETDGTDDDRPARIRETTTRDGGTVTSLKEVDFKDDATEEWLSRNRTVFKTRAGGQ